MINDDVIQYELGCVSGSHPSGYRSIVKKSDMLAYILAFCINIFSASTFGIVYPNVESTPKSRRDDLIN